MIRITEAMLDALRAAVSCEIGEYRMAHTLGVERAAAELAALYCPEKANLLRAAALLHDVTKELTDADQLNVFAANGITLRPDEAASPKVWHGMTAALLIPARYPDFADAELILAVRWHTTGHAGFTLTEAIVYLADLIEEGRRFPDCVAAREYFWGADPERMTPAARRSHLRNTVLLSLENTLSRLQGDAVCLDTLAARDALQNTSEL
jgi:predicted HD superfamily hydrolase involved in NAD metabolism